MMYVLRSVIKSSTPFVNVKNVLSLSFKVKCSFF